MGGRTASNGYGNSDSNRQKFGGSERDSESTLDYHINRYYSPTQGRFTSTDPEGAGATPSDPQSWNGYAYARNNPIVFGDPDGLSYQYCYSDGKCYTYTD